MKTTLLMALATTLALATGFAVRATHQAGRATTAAVAGLAECDELRRKISNTEERVRVADGARADLERKIAAAQAEQSAAEHSASATKTPAATARRRHPETILASEPERLAAYLKDFRESLDLKWGAMFHAVGLSAEQREKFKDLKVWAEQRSIDILSAMEAQRLGMTPEAYNAVERLDAAEYKQREAGVLGDRADKFREYHRTESVRSLVRRLASSGVYPDAPLTPVQVEHVTQILADHSRRNSGGSVLRFTVNWEHAPAQLQAVISPPQLAGLRHIHRQMELVQQHQREIDRVLAPLKAKSSPQ